MTFSTIALPANSARAVPLFVAAPAQLFSPDTLQSVLVPRGAAFASSAPVRLSAALQERKRTAEETLVQRLQDRDERALSILHKRYAKNLLAVITRMVRDQALAEDVLQEGLLKVWLSIASYDPGRVRLDGARV